MKIKLNESSVEKVIAAGANHWVKGDYDRYYIDVKDLIDYDFYKTGNVSHASINGEKISNSKGTSLLYTKIFVEDNELVCDDEELIKLAMSHYNLEEASEDTKSEEPTTDDNADETKALDSYLNEFKLTRYRLAKMTGLEQKTLQRANEQEATKMNSNVIFAIARVLHKMPGQVLSELTDLEMNIKMTTNEILLVLNSALHDAGVEAEVLDQDGTVVAEISLPSGESISTAVNAYVEDPLTRKDLLNEFGYAMNDYDHEEEDGFYPTYYDDNGERPLIDTEYTPLSKEDAEYLEKLSRALFKATK